MAGITFVVFSTFMGDKVSDKLESTVHELD